MSILNSFYQQFIERHDFEDSDINVFLNRWKNKASFKEIPLAWVLPLDTMMFELNKRNYVVKSVHQEYGQLIVTVPADYNVIKAFKIIDKAKSYIKKIDEDLYSLFEIDIEKEYMTKRHNDLRAAFHAQDKN